MLFYTTFDEINERGYFTEEEAKLFEENANFDIRRGGGPETAHAHTMDNWRWCVAHRGTHFWTPEQWYKARYY
jgi:hypothetical protein